MEEKKCVSTKKFVKMLNYPCRIVKMFAVFIIDKFRYFSSLKYIAQTKKFVQIKINNKESVNVVFIVQYIPSWNKLEPIYTKMKNDIRFKPYIVCVPSYIQNHKLMDDKENDTFSYFVEHGYQAIDALRGDGGWYELKQLKPDYVFHSRPYNYFMPTPYTSREIVKYALICNVLYGINVMINTRRIVLNRDYFRDTFLYFSFDKNESLYYENRYRLGIKTKIQKCAPFGAIGLESMLSVKKEKKGNQFKKTVLWTPRWSTDRNIGGSNFFNYKRTFFKLAEDNKNIMFICRPHPLMFGNFVKTGEMTENDVINFKKSCEQANNIFLDENKEYTDEFWNSDILITDISGIVPEYFVTGKPIIYCHTDASLIYTESFKKIIECSYEVYNKEDLKKTFYCLINDIDEKKKNRFILINDYRDVINSSKRILDALIYI